MTETSSSRAVMLAGIKDTIPLIVGAIPFGIIFGAVAGEVLSQGGTLAMSAFVFAGSAQFIAVGLLGTGVTLPVIIMTTLVVNLRHMLYSASLGPYLRHVKQRWLIPLAFWLTDETYLVVIRRYQQGLEPALRPWYFFGSAAAMYVNWQISTLVGMLAGQWIDDPKSWGLDFALYVTFIGMTVPAMKNRSAVVSVLVAGATAVAANGLPNKLGLILAALAGVAAGMIAKSLMGEAGVEVVAEEAA